MKPRDRRIAFLVAAGGLAACSFALLRFLGTIFNNGLVWSPRLTVRDHYLAVGDSYTQGFVVGFFLCFFLGVLAVALGSWLAHPRREPTPAESSPPEPVAFTTGLRDRRRAGAAGPL